MVLRVTPTASDEALTELKRGSEVREIALLPPSFKLQLPPLGPPSSRPLSRVSVPSTSQWLPHCADAGRWRHRIARHAAAHVLAVDLVHYCPVLRDILLSTSFKHGTSIPTPAHRLRRVRATHLSILPLQLSRFQTFCLAQFQQVAGMTSNDDHSSNLLIDYREANMGSTLNISHSYSSDHGHAAPPAPPTTAIIYASNSYDNVDSSDVVTDSRHKHPLRLTPQPYAAEPNFDGYWRCDWCSRGWRGASLHCAECRFDLCPDCAVQRYEGAVAEAGEANTLTAVQAADSLVSSSRHQHKLREWHGRMAECSVCRIGSHNITWSDWRGRHYRCSLDKQCSFRMCGRCLDPTLTADRPTFVELFGQPFASSSAELIAARLHELLLADGVLDAALTLQQRRPLTANQQQQFTVAAPAASEMQRLQSLPQHVLQRQCDASQWRVHVAIARAMRWYMAAGMRDEWEGCTELVWSGEPRLSPDAMQRRAAMLQQAWAQCSDRMVSDPRHPHARLAALNKSVSCELCGLRWQWEVFRCVDADCKYAQCGRCTLFPDLPPALPLSHFFSLPLTVAAVDATHLRLTAAFRRGQLELLRRGLATPLASSLLHAPEDVDAADSALLRRWT